MPKFERHLFVCMNERPDGHPRGCCGSKGAAEVRARCKDEVSRRGLKGVVRANQAGCLNQCAKGVCIVVYPEQVWYGAVTTEDVTEIFDRHIANGEVVERLRIPDEIVNTPEAIGPTRVDRPAP